MDPITIRSAREADVPALLAIYRPYVTDTFITFEYEVPSEAEFLGRLRSIRERYPYLAAQAEGRLLGYAYAAPFKARPAYGWAVETTIYVDRDCRGRGVGRLLYQELERRLAAQNILNLNACIAWPNPESVAFHQRFGYRMVGRFRACGYKLGAWRDMVWMEKHLGDHPAPPPPVLPPENS